MSTIPEGLRADYMRQRMLDKATITSIGGLYFGSRYGETYQGESLINGYRIAQLSPSAEKYALSVRVLPYTPLTKGNIALEYRQIPEVGFVNGSITAAKIGDGGIISPDPNTQYKLQIDKAQVPSIFTTFDLLVIEYMNSSYNFDYSTMPLTGYKTDDIVTISRESGNTYYYRKNNPKVEFDNNIYYVVEYDNGDGDPKRCVHYSSISLKSNSTEVPQTERTSSPYKNASLVTISERNQYPLTIYYGDRLTLSPVLRSGGQCFFAIDDDPAVYCHSTDTYSVQKTVTDKDIKVAQYKVKEYLPIVYDWDGYPDDSLGTITSERILSDVAHLPLVVLDDYAPLCIGDKIRTTYTLAPYAKGQIEYRNGTGTITESSVSSYGGSMTITNYINYPGVDSYNCFIYAEPATEYTDSSVTATATLVENNGQWEETIVIHNYTGGHAWDDIDILCIRNSVLLNSTPETIIEHMDSHTFSASTTGTPTVPDYVYIMFKLGPSPTYSSTVYYLRVPYNS